MRPLVPKGILSVRQTGIGHSSFSSGVSSFGLELIFETIIPVQVTTTTQRYIPIRENPLIIKDRLGHEDIETTLGTYGHLYPNVGHLLLLKNEAQCLKNDLSYFLKFVCERKKYFLPPRFHKLECTQCP